MFQNLAAAGSIILKATKTILASNKKIRVQAVYGRYLHSPHDIMISLFNESLCKIP